MHGRLLDVVREVHRVVNFPTDEVLELGDGIEGSQAMRGSWT